MQKYQNPFLTLTDMFNVLRTKGTDPLLDDWSEKILSVACNKVYAGGKHHYKVEIHMVDEGFNDVVALMGCDGTVIHVKRRPFTAEFDKLWIEPSSLLEIFALVPKEETNE